MFDTITGQISFMTAKSFDSNIGYIGSGDHHVLIDTGTGMNIAALDRALKRIGSSLSAITDIILTHSHIDHIGGVPKILSEGSPKVHLHKAEADMINSGDMSLTLGSTFGTKIPQFKVNGILEEGSVLVFGDVELKVIHTPGHSHGSICLYSEEDNLMFTGDTMFPGGSFGRVDFPTGSPKDLVHSLKRLTQFDFEIALPGHMNPVKHNAKRSALSSYNMASGWFKY